MNSNKLFKKFQSFFSSERLDEIARQQGLIKRTRKAKGHSLISSLFGGLMSGCKALTGIHRYFNLISESNIEYKPFHNKLRQKELTNVLKSMLSELIGVLKEDSCCFNKNSPFNQFKSIYIQDGSSMKVHNQLAEIYPSRFNHHYHAAVEIHATLELKSGLLTSLEVSADTTSERAYLPKPESLKGDLLLGDRGYPSIAWMKATNAAGGHYVFRATNRMNPKILEAKSDTGKIQSNNIGKRLKDAKLPKDKKSSLWVQFYHKNGQRLYQCRMIVCWNPQTKRYFYLLTNLPEESFDAQSIVSIYGLRWQIELLFKEAKSFSGLKTLCTRDKNLVNTLIYAAFIITLIKRLLALMTQKETGQWISTLKAAQACNFIAHQIIDLITATKYKAQIILKNIMMFLQSNAKKECKKKGQMDRKNTGWEVCI